ncbi:MAG: SCP2 sterol-binding domain-containing protein [Anaerolineae bacterium]
MSQYESAEALYDVIEGMVANLQESDAFKKRVQYAKRTVGFKVTDPAATFKLSFQEGEVSWEKGTTEGSQITLRMSGDLLHQIFTGARDAEAAYMVGDLRLEGDEYTAQGMLYYMGDLVKAFKQASEEA